MKSNRGITLIAVIVTVIIMLILASVGIYVGMDTVEHSRVVKFVSYMQIIQRRVDELASSNNYEERGTLASEQSNAQTVLNSAKANGEIQNTVIGEYKYFDSETLSSQLGIDNIEDNIIINFKTREVVSLNGIEYKGQVYYTQYLLPTGQQIINKVEDEDRTLSFDLVKNNNGLNQTIQIANISIFNGNLSYQEKNGQEKLITNYTEAEKDEEVTISKSGTYIFKLTDNTKSSNFKEKTVNILLGNSPELPEGWSYTKEDYDYSSLINSETGLIEIGQITAASVSATDAEGTTYYWIPRFAYRMENGKRIIKLIKGSSLIATDNTTIDVTGDNPWTIPEEFSNAEEVGYLEKTGIWFKTTDDLETTLFQ